jgi:hypothetical protein
MINNAILLQNFSVEELEELLGKTVLKELSQLREEISKNSKDVLLTREETCKFLKVDSSTLWSWTNKGKVKAYGIGSRRYYKKNELIESLKEISSKSNPKNQ